MSERNTFVNALVGAAVSVVLSFLPFSPVLGGAVAGYLERGDTREGAIVGGLSGFLATIPMALVFALVAGIFLVVPVDVPVMGRLGVLAAVFVLVALVVGLYTIGLSAVGGVVGAYVAAETDIGGRDDGG